MTYVWYISVSQLLHAEVLLVVFYGVVHIADTIYSMQETPFVLLGPLLGIVTRCGHDSVGAGSACVCTGANLLRGSEGCEAVPACVDLKLRNHVDTSSPRCDARVEARRMDKAKPVAVRR